MNLRSILRIGASVAGLAAFAGIVVNAQTAPPGEAAAAPSADQAVTFVKPLFTEDFESGKINTDIWTVTTQPANPAGGGRAGGGGRGAGGGGGAGAVAATPPATLPAGTAGGGGTPSTTPTARAGGRRGGRGGRGGGGPVINPTIDIVQDQTAHGKYAMHLHFPANASSNSYAMLVMKLPEDVKTHLFGRVYMKISPQLGTSHTVLFFAGTPNWPNANFLELGNYQGKDQPSIQQNDPNTPPRVETTKHGASLPTEKWFCVEWEMNDKPDTINTWIDGKPADSFTYSIPNEGNTDLIGGFVSFGIGARYWGAIGADTDIYYDDLAIGTGRIGPVN
jgi:hypothetical protein